ncbi:MAG: dethiobiotin synthase [Myxococcota bacterium]
MSETLFVTGTDTEVGKSVVTACLAAGRPAGAHAAKLVASGVDAFPGEDAALLARAAGHPPSVYTTYTAPLSPHRAAALEGRPLDLDGFLQWLSALRGDPLLVEGVGGWTVPLTPGFAVSDAARHLGAPVLVVAADRLGVLNHTLLTCRAVRDDGCTVRAVVLNQGVPGDGSSRFNLDDLRDLLDVPVLPLPSVDPADLASLAAAGRALWADLA